LEGEVDDEKRSFRKQTGSHRRDQMGRQCRGGIDSFEEGRQRVSKGQEKAKNFSALMREQEDETEDRGESQKTELAVLSPTEKLVKGPQVLRYRHNGNKNRCEKDEDSTKQNAGVRRRRVCSFNKPVRDGC
jgi:hypothetical protein